MPKPETYTHVRLIEDKERIPRFEIRVSTFIEFDENPGRRAISGKPSREEAMKIAQDLAREAQSKVGLD